MVPVPASLSVCLSVLALALAFYFFSCFENQYLLEDNKLYDSDISSVDGRRKGEHQ